MIKDKILKRLRVVPGKGVSLKNFGTGWAQNDELKDAGKEAVKERAGEILQANREALSEAQELLWASDSHSVLIVLQGMDTAGKDGTIRHVMSGVNPQGCRVYSFGVPTADELDHDYFWRYILKLPAKGEIGIFNRSYYEEVLVVRVHPELLDKQRLPPGKRGKKFWETRYRDINEFERHLAASGTLILKFFLHISKDEQKKRLLERLENEEKYWKFSLADLAERRYWDEYQDAYEKMLENTSTEHAPWYVIPADYKWAARALVADVITTRIQSLDLHYPAVTPQQMEEIRRAREILREEE
ncbi:PPK2 family polyphosphate:nucleotide phosphotransferase [Methanolinea mesophila]|uniref:polyphosphate kinase 2 family protein n=1 Tax=Methanolinea mesophila TaxID=547055 RepID=UPI001AE2F8B2|nr:polyphosphate kinase 2 family protein [Methanolinea mesophila]MBP1928171.1 PPK2 family polyphosphate:nucleotide phosphotransferase [Methanolinea mesophila]